MDDKIFVNEIKNKHMVDSLDILNYYRNLYHTEDNNTERGIVANAINDILVNCTIIPNRTLNLDDHPCTNCGSKEHCDQWDAMFCCTLCQYEGIEHCDDCDALDI